MGKKYRCISPCFFRTRQWEEGETLPSDIDGSQNPHFELVDESEIVEEEITGPEPFTMQDMANDEINVTKDRDADMDKKKEDKDKFLSSKLNEKAEGETNGSEKKRKRGRPKTRGRDKRVQGS
jgi:hypothetical protein